MKLSRRDPYRMRRNPLSLLRWIALALIVLLLALSWWKGGKQAVSPVEIPVPAEKLAG